MNGTFLYREHFDDESTRGGREDYQGYSFIMDTDKKKAKGGEPVHDGDVFGSNSEIARKLRSYYGSLVADDVPDRFTQLLSQLESAETVKKED